MRKKEWTEEKERMIYQSISVSTRVCSLISSVENGQCEPILWQWGVIVKFQGLTLSPIAMYAVAVLVVFNNAMCQSQPKTVTAYLHSET